MSRRRRTGIAATLKRQAAQIEAQRKRQAHQRYIDVLIATEDVRRLTPAQFERYVGMLFEGFGCVVEHTGRTNDGGVDLVVNKNGKRGIVQCKQYAPENKVGAPTVRDLRGTMVRERAALGFLVTTSTFTRQAIEEATYAPKITLLDVEKPQQLTEDMNIGQTPPPKTGAINDSRGGAWTNHETSNRRGQVNQQQPSPFWNSCISMFSAMFGGTVALIVFSLIMIVFLLSCCFAGSVLFKDTIDEVQRELEREQRLEQRELPPPVMLTPFFEVTLEPGYQKP